MAREKMTRFQILLDSGLVGMLDDYCGDASPPTDRAKAIRHLLRIALEREGYKDRSRKAAVPDEDG